MFRLDAPGLVPYHKMTPFTGKNLKMRTLFVLLAAAILVVVIIVHPIIRDYLMAEGMKARLEHALEQNGEISLSEMTPYAWDTAYYIGNLDNQGIEPPNLKGLRKDMTDALGISYYLLAKDGRFVGILDVPIGNYDIDIFGLPYEYCWGTPLKPEQLNFEIVSYTDEYFGKTCYQLTWIPRGQH